MIGLGPDKNTEHSRYFLSMHEAVPVHMERSPVLSSAPVQPSGYSLIQVAQHHLFILFEQFAGELGENLEESKVGRGSSSLSWILQRVGCHQDSLSVQACHSLPVLQGVQPEAEAESLRQLLDSVEVL